MYEIQLNKSQGNITLIKNTTSVVLTQTGRRGPQGPVGPPASNIVTSVNTQIGDVVLDAGDVGADPVGSASTAESNANDYTDTAIAAIDYPVDSVNGRTGAVTGLAEDNAVVHLTGDETIADVKTFSSSPIVPAPTTNTQAANKIYVDDAIGAIPGDAVTSVFGRTGAVVSALGDYLASQITNTPAGGISATTVQAALNELDTEKANTSALASYVLKAGDTMSGALILPEIVMTSTATGINSNSTAGLIRIFGGIAANGAGIVLGGSTNGGAPSTGLLRVGATNIMQWAATAIYPGTTLATDVGSPTFYWKDLYARRHYLNSTAYLDGASAGSINVGQGLFGILATGGAATHSLTLGSAATGIALYNTSDQTTNYERVRHFWSSNVYVIGSEFGGSASPRSVRINAFNRGFTINSNSAGGNQYLFDGGTISSASSAGMLYTFTSSASSGTHVIYSIAPTISQTSTAGYTGLLLNVTESTTGSGTNKLADFQVGSSSRFEIFASGAAISQNRMVAARHEVTGSTVAINGIYLPSANTLGISTNSIQRLTVGTAGLNVVSGDVEVSTIASGVIIKSPDGTRYRITVANGGALTTTAI